MSADRYPLSWPAAWKRTPAPARKRAAFRSTSSTWVGDPGGGGGRYLRGLRPLATADAMTRLGDELRKFGVSGDDWIASTNQKLNLRGIPYGGVEPSDPGVAVYFRIKGRDHVLACDTWDRVADNLGAIAWHVDAMRAIRRYGVGTVEQAFAGYVGLPARGETWRTTLGFAADAAVTADAIDHAFRERARACHPDVAGGSQDAMASLTAARAEGLAEVRRDTIRARLGALP